MDDPSMMPDLSHLSAEEREIIEQVFKRQRDEEAKETQMSQKATEELSELNKQITERKETSKKLIGTQDDAICQICQKTKFADGIGHKCFYCQLRSCARCGGRAQSKNKAIWACSLCQKRQQILAKTGKWFQPEEQPHQKISVSEPSSSPQPSTQPADNNIPQPQSEQRQAEHPDKMNNQNYQNNQSNQSLPQQNLNGPKQNQNQNQNQNHHQGVGNHQQNNRKPIQQQQSVNQNQKNHNQNQNQIQNQNQNFRNQIGPQTQHHQNQRPNENRNIKQPSHQQQQPQQHQAQNQFQTNMVISGNQQLPHQGPHHQSSHNQQMSEQQRTDNNRMREGNNGQGGMFNKHPSLEQTATVNKYNQGRVEEDITNQRPTFYTGNSENDQIQNDMQNQQNSQQNNSNNLNQNQNLTKNQNLRKNAGNRVTEEDYASSSNFESKTQRNHNSQNQCDTQGVRACPPTDDHLNRVKNRLHRQLRSMSSSEEDIISGGGGNTLKMSTSAVVAAGGKTAFHDDIGVSNVQRLSEECNSEKDLLRYIYGDHKNADSSSAAGGVGVSSGNNVLKNMQANRRRDKSISLSPSRNEHFGPGSISGGDLLASRIRTFLSHPVTWQPSADQKRLIGHMILHRTENTAANGDLGLKIVGGRRTDTGKLGAFITQVKPGSVADTIGRLRPGDEVAEWNGQSLQNATYEQVYDSIAASRYDTSVELIVSRSAIIPGGDDFLNLSSSQMPSSTYSRVPPTYPSQFQRQLPNPELFLDVHPSLQQQLLSHSQSAVFPHNNTLTTRNRSTSSYYYSDVPDLGVPNSREMPDQQSFGTGHIFGRIEVSFVYSHHDRQLSVALVRGFDLPPRSDGTPRNPYVKIFLLPDRSEKSRRQSAVIAETLMPVWDEVFYYNGLTEPMLLQRVLELTVWDYDKFGTNSFLGETLIDLASVPLDGEHSLMCILVDMDDDNPLRTRLKLRKASYNAPTRRPQSELNYYDQSSNYYNHISQNMDKQSHHHLGLNDEENDEYIDDDELENDIDLATGGAARKSRAYRREKGMHGGHGYADWTQNQQRQSGYTSDHSYGRQNMMGRAYNRRQQRRPRSATALSQIEREEMYDQSRKHKEEDEYSMRESARHGSQYYLGDQPLYEDGRYKIPQSQMMSQQHNQQQQQHPLSQVHQQQTPGVQPQHHQGYQLQGGSHHLQQQPQQPTQQVQQMMPPMPNQGYYSDGSETLSVHSTNSMPTTMTTVNRRNMNPNNSNASNDNTSYEDAPNATSHRVSIKEAKQNSLASSSSVAGAAANNSNPGSIMKERKKSLMTRFIPGRGAEGKRTGFARSEEVGIPGNFSSDRLTEPTPPFLKQASKESTDSAHSDNWLPVLADGPLGTFVDNLGPGQVVGRQVLASPVLGEIQIALMAGRSGIDVEIIKAKNLVVKPGVKVCPAPYVKVYLMEGKQCVAKAKTNAATKTTSPLFQQHLIFNDSPKKKTLQVTVLGDYGRMERKVFMGISQIRLEDLELGSQPLIGWYKLFHSSSLAGTGPVRKDSDVSVGGAQQ